MPTVVGMLGVCVPNGMIVNDRVSLIVYVFRVDRLVSPTIPEAL